MVVNWLAKPRSCDVQAGDNYIKVFISRLSARLVSPGCRMTVPTGMEGCPQSGVIGRTTNNIMVTIVQILTMLPITYPPM